jgi:hypothetical protein
MSTMSISCPYCNSIVPAPAAASPGRRLDCPRCGESFPYRPPEATESASGVTNAVVAGPLPPAAEPEPGQYRANRRLALGVLAGMGGMALLGLIFALATVKSRRSRDPQPLPPPEPPALAYLAPGTDLVLMIHVASAQQTPAGQAFLQRADLAGLGFGMADVENALGLKREQLTDVVLGIRLEEMRIVLIAQTRQPYDPEKVRAAIKASRRTDLGKKEVHYFNLDRPRTPAALWLAGKRTLVIGQSSKDLEALPDEPAPGRERLPTALQALIQERINPNSQAWLAGQVDKADALRALLALGLPEEDRQALGKVSAFGFGIQLTEGVKLEGAIHCKDESGAGAVAKRVAKAKEKGTGYLRVLGSGSGGEAVARELGQTFKVEQKGTWITVGASARAETVRKALEQ